MPTHGKTRYAEYLQSPHWAAFKRLKSQMAPKHC